TAMGVAPRHAVAAPGRRRGGVRLLRRTSGAAPAREVRRVTAPRPRHPEAAPNRTDHGNDSDQAAFEVGKGSRKVLVLSEQEVVRVLDPIDLLRELERSFAALARGEVQCPPRPQISVPDRGFSLAMAAWQPGMQICVKVVNVFDGNLKLGLPNHLALINLFDPDTGAATCVMDGTQ